MSNDIGELLAAGVAAQSSYLDREAAKRNQEMAEAFWTRVRDKLDEDDYAALLELVRDLQAAAPESEGLTDEDLQKENAALRRRVNELEHAIRNR